MPAVIGLRPQPVNWGRYPFGYPLLSSPILLSYYFSVRLSDLLIFTFWNRVSVGFVKVAHIFYHAVSCFISLSGDF